MEIQVVFDCEELLKKFEFLKQDKGNLRRKITRAILQPLKSKTRKRVRKIFKPATGRTAKNTDIWAFKDGSGRLFLGTFYGRFKEGDHFIRPKEKEFLKFKIGDKWFKKKDSIFIKKVDVTASIWKEGTSDVVMKEIAEKTMKFEFDKWRKK
ncbi:hypothetical protein E4O04_08920 [Treponema sp. OMZ 799]|uniref:hypothetical protein n=1 Tax=Treponema sp. OMZ 799 TaxID=2563668 RepID=UPI0020A3ADDA|nr:hypothetical protein [Treponema sp. OMZ 799]UTC78113.1 hypothetical protein E4O04_08920 [Treponema sp. OMZ 799]